MHIWELKDLENILQRCSLRLRLSESISKLEINHYNTALMHENSFPEHHSLALVQGYNFHFKNRPHQQTKPKTTFLYAIFSTQNLLDSQNICINLHYTLYTYTVVVKKKMRQKRQRLHISRNFIVFLPNITMRNKVWDVPCLGLNPQMPKGS